MDAETEKAKINRDVLDLLAKRDITIKTVDLALLMSDLTRLIQRYKDASFAAGAARTANSQDVTVYAVMRGTELLSIYTNEIAAKAKARTMNRNLKTYQTRYTVVAMFARDSVQ